MVKKFHFLALTDHRGHTSENSLYALLSSLSTHPQCASIDVASRGNNLNDPFFYKYSDTGLFIKRISPKFRFQPGGYQFLSGSDKKDIGDYQVIFMRMPYPIDNAFFSFLELIGKNLLIINQPRGIQRTSSKAYLLNFPKLCPPMRLCSNLSDIFDFGQQFPIVLKPLRQYGGKGILKIDGGILMDRNNEHDAYKYLEKMKDEVERNGYLAMKFLRNVTQGHKRILVVNGKIMASSLRKPAEGSWLCNVAQGGISEPSDIAPEESKIIKSLHGKLKEEGILLFGADTLVDDSGKRVLSEINTLSIGGFAQAEKPNGKSVVRSTINNIFDYVSERFK